jgi:hypothetical protein
MLRATPAGTGFTDLHKALCSTFLSLAAASALAATALSQGHPSAPASPPPLFAPQQPTQRAPTAETAPAPQPQAAADARVVRPRDITVMTGSRFRVGNERYQVFGVRTPRPRGGQCIYERLRGRQSRAALRRILSRGEIQIAPTGQVNALGDRIARVTVDGRNVARRLIDARAGIPRRLSESYNPWCISLRRAQTPPSLAPAPAPPR